MPTQSGLHNQTAIQCNVAHPKWPATSSKKFPPQVACKTGHPKWPASKI